MPDRITFLELLPDSIKNDATIQAAAAALDAELIKTESAINNVVIIPRISEQPLEVVDTLAKMFHVDFYEPWLTLEQRRGIVKNSLLWHTQKGTPSAIEGLVYAIFSEAMVTEWYEYGGNPYWFRVTIDSDKEETPTDEVLNELYRAIHVMKNTRSWMELIWLLRQHDLNMYHAMGVQYKTEAFIDSDYFNGQDVVVDKAPWYFCGISFHVDKTPISMVDYS